MAIVVRVKAGVLETVDGVEELVLPPPAEGTVRGVVRLWYEQPSPPAEPGIPVSKSNKWIVVGDDIGPTTGPAEQRYGEAVQLGHVQRLGGYEDFLAARGLVLDDYISNGQIKRSFSMDMAVPASMIDSYVG